MHILIGNRTDQSAGKPGTGHVKGSQLALNQRAQAAFLAAVFNGFDGIQPR